MSARILGCFAFFPIGLCAAGCGNFRSIDPPAVYANPKSESALSRGITAYWVGHATVLIRIEDRWILTDPIFSERIAGIERRRTEPGIHERDLPPLDAVLVSHAHVDHMDIRSLRNTVTANAMLVVPPGAVRYLPEALANRAVALQTWSSVDGKSVRVTAVPALHSDDRYVVDRIWNRDAHTGYVIEYAGYTIFFAGDTAYDPLVFKQIGERFRIDLALIPVGPSGQGLRWFRKHEHANPDEAMQLFQDVNAKRMLAIHFGTFFRSGDEERAEILQATERHGLAGRVAVLHPGEALRFTDFSRTASNERVSPRPSRPK